LKRWPLQTRLDVPTSVDVLRYGTLLIPQYRRPSPIHVARTWLPRKRDFPRQAGEVRGGLPSFGRPVLLMTCVSPPVVSILLQVAQTQSGVPMKVNVEIDCTPLEARQFFGLPDVQPMQTAVMEKLQQQMMANIQKVSPEALMQSWLSFDPKIAERFQDMFVTMAGLGGTRSADKK
jgi:hypothetical protein